MPTSQQLQRRITSLQILQEAYPKQLLISFSEAVSWLGVCIGTARNWVSAGAFPIPTQKLGDLRQVDIRDLAAYLDRMVRGEESQPATAVQVVECAIQVQKRGRGRPRKCAKNPVGGGK